MAASSRILVTIFSALLGSTAAILAADDMNSPAERYAHLVLALGQHDPDYVDAFYGPAEWKAQAEKEKKSLDAIGAEATQLLQQLKVEGTVESSDAGNSGDE